MGVNEIINTAEDGRGRKSRCFVGGKERRKGDAMGAARKRERENSVGRVIGEKVKCFLKVLAVSLLHNWTWPGGWPAL